VHARSQGCLKAASASFARSRETEDSENRPLPMAEHDCREQHPGARALRALRRAPPCERPGPHETLAVFGLGERGRKRSAGRKREVPEAGAGGTLDLLPERQRSFVGGDPHARLCPGEVKDLEYSVVATVSDRGGVALHRAVGPDGAPVLLRRAVRARPNVGRDQLRCVHEAVRARPNVGRDQLRRSPRVIS
jgi:hypothetical protein